jgi:hypothetical protein
VCECVEHSHPRAERIWRSYIYTLCAARGATLCIRLNALIYKVGQTPNTREAFFAHSIMHMAVVGRRKIVAPPQTLFKNCLLLQPIAQKGKRKLAIISTGLGMGQLYFLSWISENSKLERVLPGWSQQTCSEFKILLLQKMSQLQLTIYAIQMANFFSK